MHATCICDHLNTNQPCSQMKISFYCWAYTYVARLNNYRHTHCMANVNWSAFLEYLLLTMQIHDWWNGTNRGLYICKLAVATWYCSHCQYTCLSRSFSEIYCSPLNSVHVIFVSPQFFFLNAATTHLTLPTPLIFMLSHYLFARLAVQKL